MFRPNRHNILAGILAGLIMCALLFIRDALSADEHRHPHADAELHDKFYATWMRPDTPQISCCNKADCYPTAAKHENGQWYAKRREDGAWLPIPEEKIERKRDMPDTRSHLCAPPPDHPYYPADHVFCFGYSGGI